MSGYLLDGRGHTDWYDTRRSQGEFQRTTTSCRNWISADGSTPYRAEPGRYHLYCWAS